MNVPNLPLGSVKTTLNKNKSFLSNAISAAKDTITGNALSRANARQDRYRGAVANILNKGKNFTPKSLDNIDRINKRLTNNVNREKAMYLASNGALLGGVGYGALTGLTADTQPNFNDNAYPKYASEGQYVTDYPEERANIPVDKTNIRSTDNLSASDYYDYREWVETEGNLPDREYSIGNPNAKLASVSANELADLIGASPSVKAEMYKYAHPDTATILKTASAATNKLRKVRAGDRLLGAAILATTGGVLAHGATRLYKGSGDQLPNYAR